MTQSVQERNTYQLTQEQWARIEPLIPVPQRQGKRKVITDRQMVELLLYKEQTGLSWSKLPVPEETRMAIAKRHSRWRKNGTLQRILEELEQMELLPTRAVADRPPMAKKPPQKQPEWWEVSDEQWEQIAWLLPPDQDPAQQTGRYKTNRQILNALLYREYTNLPWREMPREFGSWRTVYARYTKWKEDGRLEPLFDAMRQLGILSEEKYLQVQYSRADYEEKREPWELNNEQWQRVARLFPPEEFDKRGKKGKSNRTMLDAILCRYHTKIPWLELPQKYGSWRTVIERYRKWRDNGMLQRVFDELELLWPLEGDDELTRTPERPERPPEWWELTDEQWNQVAGLFLPERGQVRRGSRHRTDRQALNALLYREYTGTPWAELPMEHISWRTVYDRYVQWKRDGSLERVFAKLKRMGVLAEDKYRQGRRNGLEEESLDWWEVTDEQWERLQHLFPQRREDKRGRRARDDRQMLNAILCRYYTGVPWLELPRKYGAYRTILERYRIWRDDGTLDQILDEINNQIAIYT